MPSLLCGINYGRNYDTVPGLSRNLNIFVLQQAAGRPERCRNGSRIKWKSVDGGGQEHQQPGLALDYLLV